MVRARIELATHGFSVPPVLYVTLRHATVIVVVVAFVRFDVFRESRHLVLAWSVCGVLAIGSRLRRK